MASDLFGGSALSGRLLQHLELVGLEQGLHLLQHDVQQEGATPRLLNRVIVNNVYSLSLHLLQHDVHCTAGRSTAQAPKPGHSEHCVQSRPPSAAA